MTKKYNAARFYAKNYFHEISREVKGLDQARLNVTTNQMMQFANDNKLQYVCLKGDDQVDALAISELATIFCLETLVKPEASVSRSYIQLHARVLAARKAC